MQGTPSSGSERRPARGPVKKGPGQVRLDQDSRSLLDLDPYLLSNGKSLKQMEEGTEVRKSEFTLRRVLRHWGHWK